MMPAVTANKAIKSLNLLFGNFPAVCYSWKGRGKKKWEEGGYEERNKWPSSIQLEEDFQ